MAYIAATSYQGSSCGIHGQDLRFGVSGVVFLSGLGFLVSPVASKSEENTFFLKIRL